MKATDFNYPDSPQADLFQMLKEEQRTKINLLVSQPFTF